MGNAKRINDIIDNDNVNESSLKRTSMSMTMIGKKRKSKFCSDAEAESGAERYVRIFNAPECRKFFLKVMYHLPYLERERLCAAAQGIKIKNPKKYFTYCAKKSLEKYGI